MDRAVNISDLDWWILILLDSIGGKRQCLQCSWVLAWVILFCLYIWNTSDLFYSKMCDCIFRKDLIFVQKYSGKNWIVSFAFIPSSVTIKNHLNVQSAKKSKTLWHSAVTIIFFLALQATHYSPTKCLKWIFLNIFSQLKQLT